MTFSLDLGSSSHTRSEAHVLLASCGTAERRALQGLFVRWLLFELFKLSRGLLEDGDVGIGVFPL